MTPSEMYEEYNGKCDLPDLGDTIVSCVFAGTNMYMADLATQKGNSKGNEQT